MNNCVITDCRIDSEEESTLLKLGYKVLKIPHSNLLYDAVCGHPDMLMHIIDEKNIVVHKDMCKNFIEELKNLNFSIHYSKASLESKYPYDILLNCVNLKNKLVHNIKYTDLTIKTLLKDKKMINVKQGYTKCSTAIVNDEATITSDTTISNTLKNEGIDVLLIPPKDIILPGLDYGFIGGCCGLLSKNKMAFYGDLNEYAYGKEVINFLKKYDVEPIYLRKGKLIDRGSIFTI